MSKFYKVKQDTPLFLKGAILQKGSEGSEDVNYYKAISDLWNTEAVEELTEEPVEYLARETGR